MMGGFSLLALTLAALGIYAAVSFAVERRYHEIGIRVALGATAQRVLRMVIGESLVVTALGIVVGLGLAAVAARGLEGMLFGVAPVDGATYVVTAALLAAAGAVAALLPAHRATRANPTDVLRRE
jgi:ABC-type antimicrobial peptide transport system permease subunit